MYLFKHGLYRLHQTDQELDDSYIQQACPRLVLAMDKMEKWLNSL